MLSGVELQLSTDTFTLFLFDLSYLLGYFLIGILGVILLTVGIIRCKKSIAKTPTTTPSAAPHSEAAAQETVYLMEAANGMLVHVPDSRLETWQAAQDAQRAGNAPEQTPERHILADRIVQDFYRTPTPTASKPKPKQVNLLIVVIFCLVLLLALSAIHIVSLQQQVTPEVNTTTVPPVSNPSEPIFVGGFVNINTATSKELQELPGIDAILAERIIDYRYLHGPFSKISDIYLVKGVGLSVLHQISDLISVNDRNVTIDLDSFMASLEDGYGNGYEDAYYDHTEIKEGQTIPGGGFLWFLLGREDDDSIYEWVIEHHRNSIPPEFIIPENTGYLTEANGYQQGYCAGYMDGLQKFGSISKYQVALRKLTNLHSQYQGQSLYNSSGIMYYSFYKWIIDYRNSIK